jgi:hypothetical protein
MDAELQNAQRAALAVLEKVPRLRRRIIMSFDTDIRFWRPETEPAELLADIIAARPANGASVIRSAVAKAIEELTDEGTPRSVLILLSDGVDFGSPVTETQLSRAVESANVGISPTSRSPREVWWSRPPGTDWPGRWTGSSRSWERNTSSASPLPRERRGGPTSSRCASRTGG